MSTNILQILHWISTKDRSAKSCRREKYTCRAISGYILHCRDGGRGVRDGPAEVKFTFPMDYRETSMI